MGQTRLPHLFLDYDIITFSFLHLGMMMIHFLFCDTSEKENGNIIYIYKVKCQCENDLGKMNEQIKK